MIKTIYLIFSSAMVILASPCNKSGIQHNQKENNITKHINILHTTTNYTHNIHAINIKTNTTKTPTKTKVQNNTATPTNTKVQNNTIKQNINSFVKWNGDNFVLNGKKFTPVGFNAYWLGFTEEYDYPKHVQIEEMFRIAEKIGATVIRSHTLGFSGGSPNSLRPFDNNLNQNAWEPIDYAFYMANLYNIKLVIPLIDGYNYYHGSYGEFCKTRGLQKTEFWTNQLVRSDFKRYIADWLNHRNRYTNFLLKDDPALFLIELGNELGNIRPNADSTTVPTKDWITDISSYIKSIDTNHLVLHGVDESLGQNDDFEIDSLDVYSGHFYGKDYPRIDFGANSAANVGKGYIIGEYDYHFGEDWFREIEKRINVKGTIFWNVYPHTNGYKSGSPIPHNDGYTIHYPENIQDFDRIQQHFKNIKSR